jgi:hypothetical protein
MMPAARGSGDMENMMWAGTALYRSVHRELAVDFAQTILEIRPVMLLPGLHENFERGVDRSSRLFKFRP